MRRVLLAVLLVAGAALASAVLAAGSATADRPVYVMRDLGTFGGTDAGARGINDRGQVVIVRGTGSPEAARSVRSLVWEDGRVRWLGTLAGGATAVTAINARGQVAGASVVGGVPHAFLWQNGKMRDLGAIGGNPAPGIFLGAGLALNDRGEVAGTRSGKSGPPPRAFLWRNGKMLDLGTLGGAYASSAAYGINQRGQVVGVSETLAESMRAFLWQNGKMRDISTPTNGVRLLWASAINDKGQVVALGGRIVGNGGVDEKTARAYLWSNGKITDLGRFTPGAINDKGQIIGQTMAENGRSRAVLWENGRITDLGGNTGGMTGATAINERGEIVGAAVIGGHFHAVLWTPRSG